MNHPTPITRAQAEAAVLGWNDHLHDLFRDEATIRKYGCHVRRVLRELPEPFDPRQLRAVIERYIKGGSPARNCNYLCALRSFFGWWSDEERGAERLGFDPLPKRASVPRRGASVRRPALTPEQEARFLSALSERQPRPQRRETGEKSVRCHLRDRAIFALCYFGGLRLSDIQGLRYEEIDLESRPAKIRLRFNAKYGTDALQSMGSTLVSYLEPWLAFNGHPRRGLVFPQPNRPRRAGGRGRFPTTTEQLPLTTQALEEAYDRLVGSRRIPDGPRRTRKVGPLANTSPHTLRHTWITKLIQDGTNPKTVQRLARHESLATTMTYIDDLYFVDDADRAVLALDASVVKTKEAA